MDPKKKTEGLKSMCCKNVLLTADDETDFIASTTLVADKADKAKKG